MLLEQLELIDFRSYAHATVAFGPGPNVLVGRNAQGKTNVLEAVYYLAVGSSHRTSNDAPLVRAGCDAAIVRAVARTDAGRELRVEYELRPGGRARSRVGGQARTSPREALGLVRAVLFAPEDVQIVRGDPSDRRRFLDELLTQRRPAYAVARQEYERVLRQRNALLRTARTRTAPASGSAAVGHSPASSSAAVGHSPASSSAAVGHSTVSSTLDTWTDALVTAGSTLLAARIAVLHALAGPTATAYADLLGGLPPSERPPSDVRLEYQLSTGRVVPAQPGQGVPDPGELARELRSGLDQQRDAEIERGVTLAGPHRDDLQLSLSGLPAKGFASHGETWSLVLALRLASREVLFEVGDEPVVLLDDVFAELDEQRRDRLAAHCRRFGQVLVTAAVADDVPLRGPRFQVRDHTIIPPPELVDA